jgi:hypothetical protein
MNINRMTGRELLAVAGIALGVLLLIVTVATFRLHNSASAIAPEHVLPLVAGLACLVPGVVFMNRRH